MPDASRAATAGELTAVVAVPVRNERQRVAACLEALGAQAGVAPGGLGILLFLNNCTDDTAAVVAAIAPTIPWRVRVVEAVDARATAGWARREAMEAAARWLAAEGDPDGLLLTTDADSRVGHDWVARNLAGIAAGADAVAGRIALDPAEAALLPDSLHARGRLEGVYEALLTEIGARLDPEPGNPWPCHWTASGATLAARRPAYLAVGGMPALANGEDRAFAAALRAAGFVLRQDPDLVVVTSGRLDGRASGGAADTMRLRCALPESPCDDRLERVDRFLRRVLWRRYLRRAFGEGRLARSRLWAAALGIRPAAAAAIVALPTFGLAHPRIEAESAGLAYRPLRPSQLPGQIRLAGVVLRCLRRPPPAARRGDSVPFDPTVEAGRTPLTLP